MKEPGGQLGGEAPSPQVRPEGHHVAQREPAAESSTFMMPLLYAEHQERLFSLTLLGAPVPPRSVSGKRPSILYPDHASNPSLGDSGGRGLHPRFTSQSSLF